MNPALLAGLASAAAGLKKTTIAKDTSAPRVTKTAADITGVKGVFCSDRRDRRVFRRRL